MVISEKKNNTNNGSSKAIIHQMLKDINNHKRDKKELLEFYVSERINKQVQVYYQQLLSNCNVLKHQENELLVVKKLTK